MKSENLVLYPLLAQVLLTAIVWFSLLYGRVWTILKLKVNPQRVADETEARRIYQGLENISDNLENLFEMPVLFYCSILIIYNLRANDLGMMVLAWVFVVFRILHSWIHCTSNRIIHRFRFYTISSLALWIIWVRLAGLIIF